MNNQQLNSLVSGYRDGDELALESIFRMVNPLIERSSELIATYTDDATKFDCRVLIKMRKALVDPNVNDFASYVKTIIGNERSDFLKRRKRKREDVSMAALEGPDDESLGYQFKSSANVEDDAIFNERVTLLAQGNPKKQTILLQWSKGAEDKAISELLAQLYGGKAESHRKFVQRFKSECRNQLEAEFA